MDGDEFRPHNAIAVQKNTISAAGSQYGAVADFSRPETEVGVPDVIEASEFRFPGVDQFRRSLT